MGLDRPPGAPPRGERQGLLKIRYGFRHLTPPAVRPRRRIENNGGHALGASRIEVRPEPRRRDVGNDRERGLPAIAPTAGRGLRVEVEDDRSHLDRQRRLYRRTPLSMPPSRQPTAGPPTSLTTTSSASCWSSTGNHERRRLWGSAGEPRPRSTPRPLPSRSVRTARDVDRLAAQGCSTPFRLDPVYSLRRVLGRAGHSHLPAPTRGSCKTASVLSGH